MRDEIHSIDSQEIESIALITERCKGYLPYIP